MKVLTVREPWASLIGCRVKLIETRSWSTKYRGELYIHAGLHKISTKDERTNKYSKYITDGVFHYGKIFVRCRLVDCIKIDENFVEQAKTKNPLNFACGNYALGRYAWILEDVEYIEPIVAKGKLSIWNYEKTEQ